MISVPLKPSKEWHSNANADWPGGSSIPLTVTKTRDQSPVLISVWRCNVWQRIRFLFDGRINLMVLAIDQHPPVLMTLGEEIAPK